MNRKLSRSLIAMTLLSIPASALAQNALSGSPSPETYGIASEAVLTIPAVDFNPRQSATTTAWSQGKYVTTAGGIIAAGIHLPEGALITKMEVQGCNTNTNFTSAGVVDLYAMSNSSSGTVVPLGSVEIIYASGCGLFTLTFSTPPTVDNVMNSYYLEWSQGIFADASITLRAVRLSYKLQVSPAPATATFGDVPTNHLFFQYVEALAAAGITSGCGGGNYCPDAAVTRGQMAVFLSKALGLHWAP